MNKSVLIVNFFFLFPSKTTLSGTDPFRNSLRFPGSPEDWPILAAFSVRLERAISSGKETKDWSDPIKSSGDAEGKESRLAVGASPLQIASGEAGIGTPTAEVGPKAGWLGK